MAPSDRIVIRGAREHNLKDVDLELPRNSLIVITGLSGSGKSSLAFDTIYAEGQRRYVESLSAYARQFLGLMEKPDVDFIEGLSPAISIDQKSTSKNPRSTVGTITEVYDYLRLLYARIGQPHCPVCGRPISRQTPDQIVDQILELPAGTRFQLLAPVGRGRRRGPAPAGADPAGQDLQARHRDRGRPAGRPRPRGRREGPPPPGRLGRDGRRPAPRGGPGRRGGRGGPGRVGRRGPRAPVLPPPGLPLRQPVVRGAGPAELLLQRPLRGLPGLHRPGGQAGGRPRAGRAQPDPARPRRGHPALAGQPRVQRVLRPAAGGGGRGGRLRPPQPLGAADRGAAGGGPLPAAGG